MGNTQGNVTYRYLSDKVLGKGSFGTVYEGKNTRNQERVAIKKCDVTSEKQADVVREIKSLQQINNHKHICKFLDFLYEDEAFLLVMEYCDKGDLHVYMNKYMPRLEAQIKIMHQCTSAVQYMHSVFVTNRNIKPENILFRTEGKAVIAKLCDFGLGKTTDNMDSSLINKRSVQATRAFMAPELFAGKSYEKTVDHFSLGLIFLAMIEYSPANNSLFPMSATYNESEQSSPKSVGLEMYEAEKAGSKMPVVAKAKARDAESLKGLKNLIVAMTDFEPKKRKPLSEVLSELEKLAMVKGDYKEGSQKRKHLFNSNLDITRTRAGFDKRAIQRTISESAVTNTEGAGRDSLSSTLPARLSSPEPKQPAKLSPRKEEKSKLSKSAELKTEELKKQEEAEEEGDEADVGYILVRRMVEDHMRKKREQELREKQAQEEAQKVAAALPLLILLKLLESDSENAMNFAAGDKVKVDTDYEKAKQLQVNHGGWNDKMKPYLGNIGTVESVTDGKVKVKFSNGASLVFNAHLLEKVDERVAAAVAIWEKSKFKRLDLVKVNVDANKLMQVQKSCSVGWREGMKHIVGLRGVVLKINTDMQLFVEFLNGDQWWIHPGVLAKVDLSGVSLEAGDLVLIRDNLAQVKELQKGHGDWVDDMAPCLGKSGIVRRVVESRAAVEVGRQCFVWNIKNCRLLAKSEELVMVMLMKHLGR